MKMTSFLKKCSLEAIGVAAADSSNPMKKDFKYQYIVL